MARMRVVQVAAPGAPLELVEREVPSPGAGEVRIRVEACGVGHSDSFTKEGTYPGIRYPIAPGHESRAASMRSAPGPSRGGRGSGWAWAGMVVIAAIAIAAAEATSSPVGNFASPGSPMTAAMPTT
jgi:hypothetical protein